MFLRKKAQSTAEYAITLGLVVAIAAGVLGVALKGGIRQKNKQALNYLITSGDSESAFSGVADQSEKLFTQEARDTTVLASGYIDETILEKGGAEDKIQQQMRQSTSTSVELIDEIVP